MLVRSKCIWFGPVFCSCVGTKTEPEAGVVVRDQRGAAVGIVDQLEPEQASPESPEDDGVVRVEDECVPAEMSCH